MSNKATGLMNHFKNLLLTGLFVVVPILAAVWLSWWIYNELTVWAIGLAEIHRADRLVILRIYATL